MSRKVGLVWDSTFLEHDAGYGHPERPERLIAIREVMSERGLWDRLEHVPTREAGLEELLRNHDPHYIEKVLDSRGQLNTFFDGDTQASPKTAEAALLASGGAVDLARAVVQGDLDMGFSLGRPPGHHAEHGYAMGFCYFNHIAVVARAMREEEGLERILIVDWDVHHGNGTQHSFEDDPSIAFFSVHQGHFYPGTGLVHETGKGDGRGFTLNLPLPPAMDDDDYRYCFQNIVLPFARQFQPQLILLSAGYDSHHLDPLGSMNVTDTGFGGMAKDLCDVAEEVCDGKLVAFLEGGYDLEGLSTSVGSTLEVMLGDDVAVTGEADSAGKRVRKSCRELAALVEGQWTFELAE